MVDHQDKGHILARAIIEIIGAPKEHIEKSIKEFVANIKAQGIDVIKEDYAPAEPADKMFSTFTEIEFWTKDLTELFDFCIVSMPSSIEIIEPSDFRVGSHTLSGSLNDLLQRLHTIDMTIKNTNAKSKLLEKNAFTLATNIIGIALHKNKLGLSDLAKETGIEEKKLEEFLNFMIKRDRVIKEGETYTIK